MNKTHDKETQQTSETPKPARQRHPYTLSNSREETLERMRTFPERAAKFLEKFNADREKGSR